MLEVKRNDDMLNIVKAKSDFINYYDGVNEKLRKMDNTLWGLIHHPNPIIRAAVAEVGYALDILINDENELVREQVARWKYRLDILVNDPSPYVRAAVADQGYGLEKLANDENEMVRDSVFNSLISDLEKEKQDMIRLALGRV